MARPLSPEQQAEYECEKAFTLYLAGVMDVISAKATAAEAPAGSADAVASQDAASHPIQWVEGVSNSLAQAEAESPACAREGLRMARNDLLEMSRDFSADLIRAIDEELDARGLPTLSFVRADASKVISRVLRRGRIRTEEEYYFVVERVNDGTGQDGIEAGARARLSDFVAAFEAARRGGGAV